MGMYLKCGCFKFGETAVNAEVCDPTWKIGMGQYFKKRTPSETVTFVGISAIGNT
jgi:hypothetical protein